MHRKWRQTKLSKQSWCDRSKQQRRHKVKRTCTTNVINTLLQLQKPFLNESNNFFFKNYTIACLVLKLHTLQITREQITYHPFLEKPNCIQFLIPVCYHKYSILEPWSSYFSLAPNTASLAFFRAQHPSEGGSPTKKWRQKASNQEEKSVSFKRVVFWFVITTLAHGQSNP